MKTANVKAVEPRPLRQADLSGVQGVFTDVDGTLTTGHKLRSQTVRSLEQLSASGLRVVLVSGRPAGWGEAWARQLPVDGVVVENGGLFFLKDAKGKLRKVYLEPPAQRVANRQRLEKEVERVLAQVPGARLSVDSRYTEVDLAVDYNEEARLGDDGASRIESLLRARGVTAVRSSVHVNCWLGRFDKLSASRRFAKVAWGEKLDPADGRYVYAGDSFNDAPMFQAFKLGVGVANVRAVLDRIDAPPAFITRAPEGRGFEELARALLARRRTARSRGVST
ncbi:HAD-IIB family hydrolase [Corallococcus sp. AB004]|uniref:HAD-IIB family hydrolase n=1 Tax=Corallococcus TaxID=83461 RepID=UPI000EA0C305|nr:HAD-IIB family hydrolase [Corallococcus sp. AB038B]NPC74671.1 HAD-IIB family hydrolase [Corallococcus exiguus]RKI35170.1 HAD-IIB family hydrolase [Corallococcus sp. AB004]NPD23929.1 HAD-IIB family hydrolase [Corallococcus exiguus]NRD49196.1 HAD-IIB family hydrolase [Corallococcus exiguus]RKH96936.1 HAD-IIB family hydrolase [Corallococcus sp. AB038B]